MKAYRAECLDSISIVKADSASKARYTVFKSANDVGYGVVFQEISIRRAPEYDNADIQQGICVNPEFLREG